MPPRPTFHGEIGQYLVGLRRSQSWSQRQAVTIARRRGLPVSLGSLRFLEQGKTKHPDRALLVAIATLYEVPFELLVQQFVRANYNVTVRVTRLEGDSTARNQSNIDPVLERLSILEHRVAQYESTLGELRHIVARSSGSEVSIRAKGSESGPG